MKILNFYNLIDDFLENKDFEKLLKELIKKNHQY